MRKKSPQSKNDSTAGAGTKILVIAEKPSVAGDLAKVLKVPKSGEIFENEKWVISSSIGHVVRLKDPQDLDEKLKRWTLKDLPILPEGFDGSASPDILKAVVSERNNGDRFKLLKKLLSRDDVGEVVNACDAGREGELILHYVYQLAKCHLPLKRLWLTSMTNTAIAEGFENLLPESAKAGLLGSAIGRSQADWLVGMNGSRFATIRIGGAKRDVFSVGRVQTPTLMLIVKRELEIRGFVPKTFWKIEADFGVSAGNYRGAAQVPGVSDRKEAERFYDEAQAKQVAEESLKLSQGIATDERKPKKESAPRLFDLTTLQREGNRRFGFSAKTTLGVAQGWVDSAGRRVFDNKKVSDHFAIVPTGTVPHGLTEVEQKIYDLVVRRFVGVFFPMAEFEETVRTTMVGSHAFRTTGKVLVVAGWRAVWGQEAEAEEDKDKEGAASLPALTAPDGNPAKAKVHEVNVKEDATKPPARYNEASLLGAMENAGKLVDDEALAEAMKERGLGTPATRAATIEQLLTQIYIERQGKELVPLSKAFQLHQFLHAKGMAFLTEPQLTGEWEYKLKQIEHGKLTAKEFIVEIKEQVKVMVAAGAEELPSAALEPEVLSPTDGMPLLTNGEKYFSQDASGVSNRPKLTIYVAMNGHTITPAEVAELVDKRRIGPFSDFKSMKSGKNFTGFIDLVDEDIIKANKAAEAKAAQTPAETKPEGTEDDAKPAKAPRKTKPKVLSGKLKAILYFPPREGADGNPDAFETTWPVLGICPVSGLQVQQTPTAGYRVCPQKAKEAGAKKTFSLNQEMLKCPISPEDVSRLLNEGKTGLKKFVSNRTRRTFEAFLVADKSKGWWFEFPPRKPRVPKGEKKADSSNEPF
ncbi:MAG: DNA topoisomerase III [Verrucomicrobia bacterium]|nr:DNA topoisomerase III [Verrucomicrobiota bacterium]